MPTRSVVIDRSNAAEALAELRALAGDLSCIPEHVAQRLNALKSAAFSDLIEVGAPEVYGDCTVVPVSPSAEVCALLALLRIHRGTVWQV